MIMEVAWIISVQLITTIVIISVIHRVAPKETKRVESENKILKDKIKNNEINLFELKNSELLLSEKISKIEKLLDLLKEKEKIYKKDINELEVKYALSQRFLKNCHTVLNRYGYAIPQDSQITLENKDFNWCNACDKDIRYCMCAK